MKSSEAGPDFAGIKFERFDRNILVPEVGLEGQKKILASKILVCGAGGLGSTVISSLAALGVGTIGIIDNDVLELSNLNRQFIHKFEDLGKSKVESAKQWVKGFNPDVEVNIYPVRLDEKNYVGVVEQYDFLIDCFDSFKSKFLLNEIAIKTGKALVHGGVSEFYGQVTTIVAGKTACLKCILPDEGPAVTKGVLSPVVSAIASFQALEATKLILGVGEGLQNRLLCYDGLNMRVKMLNLSKNSNCKLCS